MCHDHQPSTTLLIEWGGVIDTRASTRSVPTTLNFDKNGVRYGSSFYESFCTIS